VCTHDDEDEVRKGRGGEEGNGKGRRVADEAAEKGEKAQPGKDAGDDAKERGRGGRGNTAEGTQREEVGEGMISEEKEGETTATYPMLRGAIEVERAIIKDNRLLDKEAGALAAEEGTAGRLGEATGVEKPGGG
jgi:hypothetical protein